MKERRGPIGRTVGAVAQGLAGAARRRALEREPRALVYDGDGNPTVVTPGTAEQARLVDAAARLVALADPRRSDDAGSGEAGPSTASPGGDEPGTVDRRRPGRGADAAPPGGNDDAAGEG